MSELRVLKQAVDELSVEAIKAIKTMPEDLRGAVEKFETSGEVDDGIAWKVTVSIEPLA